MIEYSITESVASAGNAFYTTAKGGLEALTRTLVAELGSFEITVNGLAPGCFAIESNASCVVLIPDAASRARSGFTKKLVIA